MGVFESFKQKALEVREKVEEFKDNHKMASKAISKAIDKMPPPFDFFFSVIWEGLEKKGEDSSTKLLEILEKIENNTEHSFSEIKTNISELIQYGAKTEDIQKIGEQIRTSNESVIKNLKEVFNEGLKKTTETLQKTFENGILELKLSNLRLVSAMTEFGEGSRDCWKLGHFTDRDIKNGYDARRPITDKIINSIENNIGTIVYGKPYYGKSVILRRIMFEQIDKGYAVIFGNGIHANDNDLIKFLERIRHNFPKILIIADDVHKTGSEVLFKAFNHFFDKSTTDTNVIRFLFAAREEEFDIAKRKLEREKAAEVDAAMMKIQSIIKIEFNFEDALLFFTQALFVSFDSKNRKMNISENEAILEAYNLYLFSKGRSIHVCFRYYIKTFCKREKPHELY